MVTIMGRRGARPSAAACAVRLACGAAVAFAAAGLDEAHAQARDQGAPAEILEGGPDDFDFEFGTWNVRLSRLLNPLTGSTEWVDYEGVSVVRPVWNGRANLGEIEVEGPAGRIQGLSLRVYNPEVRQWRIHWSSAADGTLGPAMVGGFRNGRGEFYNQELLGGRAIFVRFIFSDVDRDSFRLEQAFSADGGKTWEPNWIAEFTRVGEAPAAASSEAAVGTDGPVADRAPRGTADRSDASTLASIRAFWAGLDRVWATRNADRFSELFAEDASFTFPVGGPELRGRAEIRRYFAGRFPGIAPEIRHRSTVDEVREVAPGLVAMDGSVEILRAAPEREKDPAVIRSFALRALMRRQGSGWTIGELRAYPRPDAATPDTGGAEEPRLQAGRETLGADDAEGPARPETRAVEFRTYNLRPGTRGEFHRLVIEMSLPMLDRWGTDIVGYGASLHDENSYVLIRAFPGVEERQRSEDAFYGSAEWREGPREAVLSHIESYATVVLELDAETVEALRSDLGGAR